MSEILLKAETRESTGKEYSKKIRKEGKVPGIFYAHNEKSVPIIMDQRELLKILSSEANLIDVQIDGKKKRKAIIKEVQTDPLKNYLVHIDVMGVKLKEKVHVSVPVHIIGEAIGVKDQGGILHQYLREIEVNCLPLDIPEFIEIDVSPLNVHESISIGSLTIENVEFLDEADKQIISVLPPAVAKATSGIGDGEIEGEADSSLAEEA